MRRGSTLLLLLFLILGLRVHGACGTPTISASYSGPNELGQGTLTMTYDLAGASLGEVYWTSWDRDTIRGGYNVSQPSGTVSVGISTACLTTGPHKIKVTARNCTGSDDPKYRGHDEVTVSVNTTPSIALSNSLRADGAYDITLDYNFPNTASPASRFVKFYKNGVDWFVWDASFVSGSAVFKTGAFCGEVTATAVVCNRHGVEGSVAYASTQLSAEHCKEDRGQCEAPGKPVNVGSGDVSVDVPLFTLDDPVMPLSFALAYHSRPPVYRSLTPEMGYGWHHSFGESMRTGNGSALLFRTRADGQQVFYARESAVRWNAVRPLDARESVTLVGGEYHLDDGSRSVMAFDAATGRWLRTTDEHGNAITAQYTNGNLSAVTDARGRTITIVATGANLQQITLPGGATWRFTYTAGNLSAIHDPMHTGPTPWRSFAYKSYFNQARLLTAMYDDAGKLLEGHAYDSSGRATTSFAEGNAELVTLQYDYPAAGSTRVTHTIDATTKQVSDIALKYVAGRFLPTKLTGRCSTCGGTNDNETREYDTAGRLVRRTDGRGAISRIDYDAAGNVIGQTAAEGTALERTTTFEYADPRDPRRVTAIIEPSVTGNGNRITASTWDATETMLTRAISGRIRAEDAAPTVLTTVDLHDSRGRLIATDGPRTDVSDITVYAYYSDDDEQPLRRGRLRSVTNAAGHVTTFDDYDAYGTPRRETDANGVVTELVTDAAGRVTQRIAKAVDSDPAEAADYVETIVRDGRDRELEILRPNGNRVRFAYADGTNFVTDTISVDSSGNEVERLHVTRNTFGSVVVQEWQSCVSPAPVCASWTTTRRQQAAYDAFNRLRELTEPDASRRIFAYDGTGAIASLTDELHSTPNTRYEYDLLGRLVTTTQTLGSTTIVTRQSYDVHDNVVSVTDPNANVTTYRYDDFDRLIEEVSPVSGAITFAYDAAGQVVLSTDANGATTERTYDVLGRVLQQTSRRSGSPDATSTFTYDSAAAQSYGIGRLASLTDPSGSASYRHDRRGNVREQVRTINGATYTLAYRHDANGNRVAITYPSGRAVTYTFDAADRPRTIASNGTALVQSVSYLPFGPMTRMELANGTVQTRTYDLRHQLLTNRLTSAAGVLADYAYTHDRAGQVTAIRDLTDATYDRTFAYDDLRRLITANSGPSLWGNGSFTYDPLGNVLTTTLGTTARTFTYAGATSKLATMTESGVTRSAVHDAAGNETAFGSSTYRYSARNQLAEADAVTYDYDAVGLRVASEEGGVERHYLYSPDFLLLAEPGHEYVWIADVPVAQIDVATDAVSYTFTDHLGTPILQTDAAANVTWRVEHEPYGAVYAARAGAAVHQPLRFPGQEERTGELTYNVYRWYRAEAGRYTQKDPIGLQGGINLYAYALDNPINYDDPLGLKVRMCCRIIPRLADVATGLFWATFSLRNPVYIPPPRHCFFQFADSRDNTPLALHGTRTRLGYLLATLGIDTGRVLPDDDFDQGSEPDDVCGPWAGDCFNNVDDCVRNGGLYYPSPTRYSALGPNSNTFAFSVARPCGVQPPTNVWAPGWNATPPRW